MSSEFGRISAQVDSRRGRVFADVQKVLDGCLVCGDEILQNRVIRETAIEEAVQLMPTNVIQGLHLRAVLIDHPRKEQIESETNLRCAVEQLILEVQWLGEHLTPNIELGDRRGEVPLKGWTGAEVVSGF